MLLMLCGRDATLQLTYIAAIVIAHEQHQAVPAAHGPEATAEAEAACVAGMNYTFLGSRAMCAAIYFIAASICRQH